MKFFINDPVGYSDTDGLHVLLVCALNILQMML